MDVSEKTPYEKFSEMGTKVITVFQYYDYAVFKIEEENGIKVPKEVEIAEPILKFGALTKSYKTVEDELVVDRHYAMEELLKSKRITNSVCNKIHFVQETFHISPFCIAVLLCIGNRRCRQSEFSEDENVHYSVQGWHF